MQDTGTILAPRHRLVVRITHWLNAVAIIMLLMTGLNIFGAHPRLYWGQAGSVDQRAGQWLEISTDAPGGHPRGYVEVVGTRFTTTGVLGLSSYNGAPNPVAYPAWSTFPTMRNLAMARNWHFALAWLLIVNGLVWLGSSLVNGHIRHELLPRAAELAPRHIWHDIVLHARLQFPKGVAALRYHILQKLAYGGVALLLIPGVIITGMAMSPGLDAALPWLVPLLGGRQTARSLHWICANAILLFTIVHLAMVVASGAINHVRGMITGRIRIEKEADDAVAA